jgi:hypothetical protein
MNLPRVLGHLLRRREASSSLPIMGGDRVARISPQDTYRRSSEEFDNSPLSGGLAIQDADVEDERDDRSQC